jgi:hypothetical protein
MSELQFEWDEDKAAANLVKHGVSFLTAAAIFAGRDHRADRRSGGLWRASADRPRPGGDRGLSSDFHLAWRASHSDHQRAEGEPK